MFRQVKFVIKRDENSPLFTLDKRTKIEDKILDLLFSLEDYENIMDMPNLSTERFTPEKESTATQYYIIAPQVNMDLNLEEIKEELNTEFNNDNISFDIEIIGGKRRSSKRKAPKKKTLGGKRRSSKRRTSGRRRRSSQRRRV